MRHPALEFLAYLDTSDEATFNIESYSDLPKGGSKPNPDPLSNRYPNLTLDGVTKLIPNLSHLNNQGAAIYVAVNEFKGQRSKANIARIRGIHADLDEVTEEVVDAIRNRLKPSLEVQSSRPTNLHFYWLLSEGEVLSPEQTELHNKALVGLGADKAAVDISRLLRLPGFRHMKYAESASDDAGDPACDVTPIVTEISRGPRYTSQQIADAFPEGLQKITSKKKAGELIPHRNVIDFPSWSKEEKTIIKNVSDSVAKQEPQLWGGQWESVPKFFGGGSYYGSQSEADLALAGLIARSLSKNGISSNNIEQITEAVFGRSGLASRPKWQNRPNYRQRTSEKACRNIDWINAEHKVVVDWDTYGDLRTAKLFADLHRYQFLYVATVRKWLMWRNEKWNWCAKGEEVEAAKTAVSALYTAAGEVLAEDPDQGNRAVRDAIKAHGLYQINAMLKLAQSEPGMVINSTGLDSDPYRLGVENGCVNLRSGKLEPNLPAHYITRYGGASFDESAECPRWLQFLDEVFESDEDTIYAAQLLLGYTLTGLSTEEIMVFCVGYGANGKSIFGNVISAILGSYSKTAPSTLLSTRRADDHSPRSDLAMLNGARLVSINELPGGMRLDEQVVKQLAGRELISARHLYGEYFSYIPTFTPWVRTNHKPIIKGDDDGIWRRIVVLPFKRKFKTNEQDPHLEAELLGESSGILGWMIDGAKLYLKSGLKLSLAIKTQQQQYRTESDLLGEFLSETAQAVADGKVLQSVLFNAWQDWNTSNGLHAGSKKTFTQRLVERGYAITKSAGKRFYTGLKVGK
jgi:putative DNA primase/helicase